MSLRRLRSQRLPSQNDDLRSIGHPTEQPQQFHFVIGFHADDGFGRGQFYRDQNLCVDRGRVFGDFDGFYVSGHLRVEDELRGDEVGEVGDYCLVNCVDSYGICGEFSGFRGIEGSGKIGRFKLERGLFNF